MSQNIEQKVYSDGKIYFHFVDYGVYEEGWDSGGLKQLMRESNECYRDCTKKLVGQSFQVRTYIDGAFANEKSVYIWSNTHYKPIDNQRKAFCILL